MPTLRTLLALPPVLLSTLIIHAYAYPDGVIGDEKGAARPTFATALTGGEGCSFSNIDDIRNGFSDMTILLSSAVPFDCTKPRCTNCM
jgi:hypothetical protein